MIVAFAEADPEIEDVWVGIRNNWRAKIGMAPVPYRRLSEMRWNPNAGSRQPSRGLCGNVADAFEAFLNKHGIKALSETDPRHPVNRIAAGMDPNPLEEAAAGRLDCEYGVDWSLLYGYGDGKYRRRRDKTHEATVIDHGGELLMIDWTASQYGYSEWPMLQRYDPERNAWQRGWRHGENE